MKTIAIQTPLIVTKINDHDFLKPQILSKIKSMGTFSYRVPQHGQNIYNTDWHLSQNFNRSYAGLLNNVFRTVLSNIDSTLGFKKDIGDSLDISGVWFQQYLNGDFHGWHNHPDSIYNSVYYVDLPEGTSKTTFKINNEEVSFDVNEGDVLSFPGYLTHCSKPNETDKMKTVVVFNTSSRAVKTGNVY